MSLSDEIYKSSKHGIGTSGSCNEMLVSDTVYFFL